MYNENEIRKINKIAQCQIYSQCLIWICVVDIFPFQKRGDIELRGSADTAEIRFVTKKGPLSIKPSDIEELKWVDLGPSEGHQLGMKLKGNAYVKFQGFQHHVRKNNQIIELSKSRNRIVKELKFHR